MTVNEDLTMEEKRIRKWKMVERTKKERKEGKESLTHG